MTNILKELFDGKIDVMESLPFKARNPVPGEEAFINSLVPEQKQTLEKMLASYADMSVWANRKCFIFGFKIAVQMILESISDIDN